MTNEKRCGRLLMMFALAVVPGVLSSLAEGGSGGAANHQRSADASHPGRAITPRSLLTPELQTTPLKVALVHDFGFLEPKAMVLAPASSAASIIASPASTPRPSAVAAPVGAAIQPADASANLTLDSTLVPAQPVPYDSDTSTFTIAPGLGRQVGGNLFYSFGAFSLATGQTASFTGTPARPVQNVLVRVTGGQTSTIDGTIQSFPGSNFYLINPAGVEFTPNAQLAVDGLFAVSTADYVRMTDGTRFSALHPADPALSTAVPAAFGFLNAHPGPITITGTSTSPSLSSTGTLSIVGGNITISQQTVFADSIRSVASAGEVPLEGLGSAPAVGNAAPPPQPRGGTLTVTDGSQIVVDYALLNIDAGAVNLNDESIIGSATQSDSPGGAVRLNARDALNVINGNIATYSEPDDNNDPAAGTSGGIQVTAPKILLQGTDDQNVTPGIFTQASSQGAAGNVTVSGVRQLTILHEASLGSVTFGSGAGGDVRVTARSVTINGTGDTGFTGIESNTQNGNADEDGPNPDPTSFTGKAGSVTLSADRLQILNAGGVVSNSLFPGAGHGGKVNVNARNILIDGEGSDAATSIDALSGSLLSSGSDANMLNGPPGGPAGSVNVVTSGLRILDGGSIRSNTTGAENAGEVHVRAQSILIDRAGSMLNTGISALVEAGATGSGGGIKIGADDVTLRRGGLITVATFGSGSAGDAIVDANDITLRSGGMIQSNAEASGDGGALNVDAGRLLRVFGGAEITSSSTERTGGNIRISSGQTIVLIHGSVTTNAAKNGGSIRISVPADIELRNDSQITTNSGGGNGGNITIDPLELTLLNGSGIHANGHNLGGTITLAADRQRGVVTKAAVPDVTAFGGFKPGAIVTAPDQLDIVGSLVLLQTGLATPAALVPQCGVNLGENQSSFVISGRGGAPAEPGGWLPDLSLQSPAQGHEGSP
jgi:filamentous hemagglutinin family protein